MLVTDTQIPLFQSARSGQEVCLFLVNVHCRLLRSKTLRLEADDWSQIKPIDMTTLIASSAQGDPLKANEAQQKLNNLISVDTKNDVSGAVRRGSNSNDSPQMQLSDEKDRSQTGKRHRNRSRSNKKPPSILAVQSQNATQPANA